MSLRMEKVNQELRRQLSLIIQKEIDDPAVDFLSITKVDTSPDLRESKVFFSILDEEKLDQVREILDKTKGFIRSRLAKKIRLKIIPNLQFVADASIKYSVDIYQKIEEIKDQERE